MREEGGFRSSVPSSITRLIRPKEPDVSAGDEEVFSRLLNSSFSSRAAYSPKFTGMELSSPTRSPRQLSISPSRSERDRLLPSSPIREQSSWQTVDSEEHSSHPVLPEASPVNQVVEEEGWENIESSPPQKTPKRVRKSSIRKLLDDDSFQYAQQQWEQLQPRSRVASARVSMARMKETSDMRASVLPDSPVDSLLPSVEGVKGSPGSSLAPPLSRDPSLHADSEVAVASQEPAQFHDADPVQYPHLSIGSSFASHVSDHGRQPDIEFDESRDLDADTLKASSFGDYFRPDEAMIEADDTIHMSGDEPLIPENDISDLAMGMAPDVDMNTIAMKPEVKAGKPSSKPSAEPTSSDDEFPPLDMLLSQHSQPSQVKREESISLLPTTRNKETRNISRSAHYSSDEEQTTPKVNKLARLSLSRLSARRDTKPRMPLGRASKPPSRVSSTKWDGNIPAGSQVMDLTNTSDEEENNPKHVIEDGDEDLKVPNRFKHPLLSDEDDDDYEMSDAPSLKVNKRRQSQQSSSKNPSHKQTTKGNLNRASSSQATNAKRKINGRRF